MEKNQVLEDALIGKKRKNKICGFCGKVIPWGESLKNHVKKRHSIVQMFYGTNGLYMDTDYVMIHRRTCAHVRHMTVTGTDLYRYAYGTLREIYVWAVKRSAEAGLSIYYCSHCNPPHNTPISKAHEKELRWARAQQDFECVADDEFHLVCAY